MKKVTAIIIVALLIFGNYWVSENAPTWVWYTLFGIEFVGFIIFVWRKYR